MFGSKTNTPVKNRKVRYFTGWVYLHRDGPKADIADKKFSFRSDIMIHNEGQKIPLLYDDGSETPYLLELAQLTYQNTRTAILKMAVIDKETKKTCSIFGRNLMAPESASTTAGYKLASPKKPRVWPMVMAIHQDQHVKPQTQLQPNQRHK
ncbi:MAG: hypothetical protein HC782_03205 [Gammaproteobacteria bacterium]|nr:hypothetical protein [Gammaproteobacteria bacterium]